MSDMPLVLMFFSLFIVDPPMHHIAELPRRVFAKAEAQLIGLEHGGSFQHGGNMVPTL